MNTCRIPILPHLFIGGQRGRHRKVLREARRERLDKPPNPQLRVPLLTADISTRRNLLVRFELVETSVLLPGATTLHRVSHRSIHQIQIKSRVFP